MIKKIENFLLYHNNRCSKSREVKNYLDSNKINYDLIDYLNKPIDKKLLNEIILNLENDLKEIIRTNESFYKSLNEHKKSIEKGNILSLITEHPKLLQRPIIAKQIDNKIIKSLICRPTELLESFIK